MRYMISLFLIAYSFAAVASDREVLLSAWENIQKNSDEVSRFEKIEDRKYQIKFKTLPFEGELIVLAYDIENINHAGLDNDEYTLSGYIETDLVDAPEDLTRKYNRTYYKWAENNTLYFNQKLGQWVTGRQYSESLQSRLQEVSGIWSWISEYFDYFLAALFVYIVYTLVFGNKHLKASLTQQKQALDDMAVTRRYMEEAMELHKETNRLLTRILGTIDKEKDA